MTQEPEPRFSKQDVEQLKDWGLLFLLALGLLLLIALALGIAVRIVTVVGGV